MVEMNFKWSLRRVRPQKDLLITNQDGGTTLIQNIDLN